MIEKPTVKELLNHAENRYALVIAASRRAREIAEIRRKKELSKENENYASQKKDLTSPVTIAADEIVDGKVYIVKDKEEELEQ